MVTEFYHKPRGDVKQIAHNFFIMSISHVTIHGPEITS